MDTEEKGNVDRGVGSGGKCGEAKGRRLERGRAREREGAAAVGGGG